MRLQGIAHAGRQGTGKALVAILADQGKLHSMGNLVSLPHEFVEAKDSPMQGVDAVVGRKLIGLAVEAEGDRMAFGTVAKPCLPKRFAALHVHRFEVSIEVTYERHAASGR